MHARAMCLLTIVLSLLMSMFPPSVRRAAVLFRRRNWASLPSVLLLVSLEVRGKELFLHHLARILHHLATTVTSV